MGDDDRIGLHTSDGGVAALHGRRTSLPVYVAPSQGAEVNTVRPPLVPTACWRIDDPRFEFDSSFVKPVSAPEFTNLASLVADLGDPVLTLFGHADPVGDDAYNKTLSGRRATAIYGVLTRDVDLWEKLYKEPFGGDTWGPKHVQTMLGPAGHDPGGITTFATARSVAATKSFQAEQGLPQTGVADSATRKKLYLAYMDAICTDASGAPFVLAKESFLGKGQDPTGKGDYQGCGELNPVLVFSREATARFKQPQNKPERDLENASNRRVVAFLFRAGTEVPQGSWPCPRASESAAGCQKMLWPDGDARRSPRDRRREYARTGDTVACRWYDGFGRGSPCEAVRGALSITLLDQGNNVVASAPYRLWLTGGPGVTRPDRIGTTSAAGRILEPNVLNPARAFVEWTLPGNAPVDPTDASVSFPFSQLIYLNSDDVDDEVERARRRLHNLGYPMDQDLAEAVALFQDDYQVPVTAATRGQLDDPTRDRLREVHDQGLSRTV